MVCVKDPPTTSCFKNLPVFLHRIFNFNSMTSDFCMPRIKHQTKSNGAVELQHRIE